MVGLVGDDVKEVVGVDVTGPPSAVDTSEFVDDDVKELVSDDTNGLVGVDMVELVDVDGPADVDATTVSVSSTAVSV